MFFPSIQFNNNKIGLNRKKKNNDIKRKKSYNYLFVFVTNFLRFYLICRGLENPFQRLIPELHLLSDCIYVASHLIVRVTVGMDNFQHPYKCAFTTRVCSFSINILPNYSFMAVLIHILKQLFPR